MMLDLIQIPEKSNVQTLAGSVVVQVAYLMTVVLPLQMFARMLQKQGEAAQAKELPGYTIVTLDSRRLPETSHVRPVAGSRIVQAVQVVVILQYARMLQRRREVEIPGYTIVMLDLCQLPEQATVHLVCGAPLAQLVFYRETVAVLQYAQMLQRHREPPTQSQEVTGRTPVILDLSLVLERSSAQVVLGTALAHIVLFREAVAVLHYARMPQKHRETPIQLQIVPGDTYVILDSGQTPEHSSVQPAPGMVLAQHVPS